MNPIMELPPLKPTIYHWPDCDKIAFAELIDEVAKWMRLRPGWVMDAEKD